MTHADFIITRPQRLALSFCVALSLLLQWDTLHPALLLLSLGLTAYFAQVGSLRTSNKSKWIGFLFALAGLTVTALFAQKILSIQTAISLLAVMLGLKLMESRASRDVMVVWCTACVLFAAFTLRSQSLAALLLTIGYFVLAMVTLQICYQVQPIKTQLTTALKIALMGIPIALILFVIFPRLSAPFWSMNQGARGKTGLSDEMRPGIIASLAQSDEEAFRVKFIGRQPQRQDLYWRGPVLSRFDGESWQLATPGPADVFRTTEAIHQKEGLDYTVTLEPHNVQFIPTLDVLVASPHGQVSLTDFDLKTDQSLRARKPITQGLQYSLSALPSAQFPASKQGFDRNANLGIDSKSNPKARAHAAKLRALHSDDGAYLAALYSELQAQGFRYTLAPPVMIDDAVDAFWFEHKAGFCEHYAHAIAFYARAANIPARVVTGYLGGEYNPAGGYYLVRAREAHAWVEVLIDNQWRRADATALIAPDRIDQGLEQSLPESDRANRLRDANGWLGQLSRSAFRQWDNAVYAYRNWFIGFNQEKQQQLLDLLKLPSKDMGRIIGIGLLLIVGIIGLVVFLSSVWHRYQARSRNPWHRLWLQLCRKLERAGVAHAAAYSPQQLAAIAGVKFPQQVTLIGSICRAVEAAVFSKDQQTEAALFKLRSRLLLARF
jgi:protein-glutamine gamma-glutamyltransferase